MSPFVSVCCVYWQLIVGHVRAASSILGTRVMSGSNSSATALHHVSIVMGGPVFSGLSHVTTSVAVLDPSATSGDVTVTFGAAGVSTTSRTPIFTVIYVVESVIGRGVVLLLVAVFVQAVPYLHFDGVGAASVEIDIVIRSNRRRVSS